MGFNYKTKAWERKCTLPWATRLVQCARIEGYGFSPSNLKRATKKLRDFGDIALSKEFELGPSGLPSIPPVQLHPGALDKSTRRVRFVPKWRVNEESDGSITVSPSLEIIGRGSYDMFAADDAPLKHDKHGFKWDGEVWYLNANGLAKIGIYSFEEVARSIHLKCIPHHQRFTVVRHHEAAVAADRLRQRASATAEDEPEIQVVASRTPDEVEEDKRRATVASGNFVDLTLRSAQQTPAPAPAATPPRTRVKGEPGGGGPQRTPPAPSPRSAKPYTPAPVTPAQTYATKEKCPVCEKPVVTRTVRNGMPHNIGKQFITCPKFDCPGGKTVWRWADGTEPGGHEAQARFAQHVDQHGMDGYDLDRVRLFGF